MESEGFDLGLLKKRKNNSNLRSFPIGLRIGVRKRSSPSIDFRLPLEEMFDQSDDLFIFCESTREKERTYNIHIRTCLDEVKTVTRKCACSSIVDYKRKIPSSLFIDDELMLYANFNSLFFPSEQW